MAANQRLILASGYATAEQPGIQGFLFNEATGEMAACGSYPGINAPSFLVVHPNQRWIYAVSETGLSSHGALGEVWAFQLQQEPFLLTPINKQSSRGDWPCHLQFDRTGNWLIATNYGSGNAALYPIRSDGTLGEMTDFVQHWGSGPNTARQESAHAHSSIFTPENRFVILADLGIDQLVVYDFDVKQGRLNWHGMVHAHPGAGPRHMVFHPSGKWLYAANELESTVTFYIYDDANGRLAESQTVSTVPAGAPENMAADIHIGADGGRLYVSNRGHNSIAAFDIRSDGALSLISSPPCNGKWPRNFAISPNGKFILVANQYSNEISVLPILDSTEVLGPAVSKTGITGASCIQFL